MRWALPVLLLTVTASLPAAAKEAGSSESVGRWAGSLVAVRWKVERKTRMQPDLVLAIENASPGLVSTDLDWSPRACGGTEVRVPVDVEGLLRWLFGGWRMKKTDRVDIAPGDWSAWIFPLGWPAAQGDKVRDCVSELVVRASEPGSEEGDTLRLAIPVPKWCGRVGPRADQQVQPDLGRDRHRVRRLHL